MELSERFPIIDVRGRGLMVAAEFGGAEGGLTAAPGTASAVTKGCAGRNMLLLSAGGPSAFASPPANDRFARRDCGNESGYNL